MRSGLIALLALLVQDGPKTTQPAPKDEKRHEGFVEIAKKGGVDLLFLGDSITDGWRGKGKKSYEAHFAPLKAANFGIGGDRTQHVLWRLRNGELEGIQPKAVMLMIGTNNGGDSADDVAAGITAIVKEIHGKHPAARVLLLGIFPRGEKPNPGREKNDKVNAIVSKLDDGGKTVTYLDIGEKFLQPDKTISKDIMPDFLHLSEKGYQIWADAIKEPLVELLK